MGQGSTAYASYVRIHQEMGFPALPEWRSLSHVGRMAWEAAAQAVASSILLTASRPDPSDSEPVADEEQTVDDFENDFDEADLDDLDID